MCYKYLTVRCKVERQKHNVLCIRYEQLLYLVLLSTVSVADFM